MDYTQIIIALVGLVSGGGIISIITALRKSNRDDFDILKASYKEEHKELKEEISSLKERLRDFEEFKYSSQLVSAANKYLPFPYWEKNINGVMMNLNHHYEKMFLLPNNKTAEDYILKTDIEFWGKEIGVAYQEGDKKAMESPDKLWIGQEPILVSGHYISEKWTIVKWGLFINDMCVGSAGMAIPNLNTFK